MLNSLDDLFYFTIILPSGNSAVEYGIFARVSMDK